MARLRADSIARNGYGTVIDDALLLYGVRCERPAPRPGDPAAAGRGAVLFGHPAAPEDGSFLLADTTTAGHGAGGHSHPAAAQDGSFLLSRAATAGHGAAGLGHPAAAQHRTLRLSHLARRTGAVAAWLAT